MQIAKRSSAGVDGQTVKVNAHEAPANLHEVIAGGKSGGGLDADLKNFVGSFNTIGCSGFPPRTMRPIRAMIDPEISRFPHKEILACRGLGPRRVRRALAIRRPSISPSDM
jgi:hypothetical protein